MFDTINNQNQLVLREVDDVDGDLNEEEKKYLLEVIDQEEEEHKQL
jgi:hypothetical protein